MWFNESYTVMKIEILERHYATEPSFRSRMYANILQYKMRHIIITNPIILILSLDR